MPRRGLRSFGRVSSIRAKAPGAGHAAFTLAELLVVVAIIGLLMLMLLPTLSRARLLAVRAVCQGNLGAIGKAAGLYQADHHDVIPICWSNVPADKPHPWKSWRGSLLGYTSGHETFNCPAVTDRGVKAQRFHSDEEVLWHEYFDTVNAGSYGVMYQYALPGYVRPTYAGTDGRGHPLWTQAFSTLPGVSWRRPAESVYVADAVLQGGPITYPSRPSHKGYGTSVIMLPSEASYAGEGLTRRFADRHVGTACLFVDGHVAVYETAVLDGMIAGEPGCIWDVE